MAPYRAHDRIGTSTPWCASGTLTIAGVGGASGRSRARGARRLVDARSSLSPMTRPRLWTKDRPVPTHKVTHLGSVTRSPAGFACHSAGAQPPPHRAANTTRTVKCLSRTCVAAAPWRLTAHTTEPNRNLDAMVRVRHADDRVQPARSDNERSTARTPSAHVGSCGGHSTTHRTDARPRRRRTLYMCMRGAPVPQ